MTLTVSSFNATTGRVNVTLADSSMEFLLSGESSINQLSSASSTFLLLATIVSLPFILRVPNVNQSITKWSLAWEWKLTIGSKDGCISLRRLTNCPFKYHSPPLLPWLIPQLFTSFPTAFPCFLPCLLFPDHFYSLILSYCSLFSPL